LYGFAQKIELGWKGKAFSELEGVKNRSEELAIKVTDSLNPECDRPAAVSVKARILS
jgi:hypothetical protein